MVLKEIVLKKIVLKKIVLKKIVLKKIVLKKIVLKKIVLKMYSLNYLRDTWAQVLLLGSNVLRKGCKSVEEVVSRRACVRGYVIWKRCAACNSVCRLLLIWLAWF